MGAGMIQQIFGEIKILLYICQYIDVFRPNGRRATRPLLEGEGT
jgi:hypothetical protein